jgi:hypothetical protein
VGPTGKKIIVFFKFDFQTESNLFCSRGDLLELEKIEIKYESVGFEIRNKFPYWNFSRFEMGFK